MADTVQPGDWWAVSRPLAEVREVHDGDTYVMLLDHYGTHFKDGAQTKEVRLRDYSCPELKTPDGQRAREVAESILREARTITVELKGQRSFTRVVGWVWVDGRSLGQLLVEAGVAREGRFVGFTTPPRPGDFARGGVVPAQAPTPMEVHGEEHLIDPRKLPSSTSSTARTSVSITHHPRTQEVPIMRVVTATALKTVGVSPKALAAFFWPVGAAVILAAGNWIATGAFDTGEIRIVAAGLAPGAVALIGAAIAKPGRVKVNV